MKTTRRDFLRATGTAVAAFSLMPRHVLGGPKFVAPSEKVNVAIIGVGGQGRHNIRSLFNEPTAQIIAVADPAVEWDLDPFYYKGKGGRGPVKAEIEKRYGEKNPSYRCAEYEDFRVMLEKEKAIDAVLIATPDHLHAYASIIAMRQGKHVYTEKPLTHNIREARLVAQVAKETGVATQMGNIGHSRVGIRETCEWIWSGAIGQVREVHSWVPTKRWNPELVRVPTESVPVPAGLNWDLWLGPRETRPFHPAYVPVKWRDFWQFGGGGLGDFGCHDMDAACWALDLRAPETIEAFKYGAYDPEMTPHGCICYYHYPARGERPPVKVVWYDGGGMPDLPVEYEKTKSKYRRGTFFIGDKGTIACEGAGGPPQVVLFDKTAKKEKPAPTLKRSNGHHRDWLDACKGGEQASSNFEYGARLTEITILGMIAQRVGKKIYWDPAAMKATGCPEADVILQGTYRKGWEVA